MKIIGKSNFDDVTVSDVLVATGISNEFLGNLMVEALNRHSGEYSRYFYKLVPDEYQLYSWEP